VPHWHAAPAISSKKSFSPSRSAIATSTPSTAYACRRVVPECFPRSRARNAQQLQAGAWFHGRTDIKHREDFHPFGFSVPAEVAPRLFNCSANCRFMASLGKLKPEAPPDLQRFAFEDGRVRVHTVGREANPRLWRLLHKFGEHAVAPVLFNTSFHLFGEPLVSDRREPSVVFIAPASTPSPSATSLS